MNVSIREERPARKELIALYGAVGWTAYTNEPERLVEAVRQSTWTLAARTDDAALAGFARVISDLNSIAYLQDILVAPEHQRRGVGGALLDEVLRKCHGIRQVVLLTDVDQGQRCFYQSRGFHEAHDVLSSPLRSFVRLT